MRRPLPPRLVAFTGLLVGLVCGACGSDDDAGEPGRPSNPLGASGRASEAPPLWELESLPAEFLDHVQAEIGRRTGVRIVRVREGGAAAQAGVHSGDVLLAVDGAVVTSPAEGVATLDGRSGVIQLTLLRVADDGAWTIPQLTLSLPAVLPAAPPVPAPATPSAPATVVVPPGPATEPARTPDRSLGGVVGAFFDMLDFARTQGWGRTSVTPEATRRRAEGLLRRHLPELDAETRSVIEGIPDAWATLRTRWAAADENDRQQQRAFWKHQLLLPNPLLPPPGSLATFRSEAGGHAFEHPADWVLAQNRVDDTGLLFLGPAGTQTTWEQVADPATSPPGVLFAISPMDEGLRAVNSPEEGTRYVARNFVTGRAPEMKEIAALRLGTGALVAYAGRWPGGGEDSFCWVAAMPFGNEKVIVGRFVGPVARAETLLPAFSVMLATTEVTPPDDLASMQVELAASIIGNAVINTGWSH